MGNSIEEDIKNIEEIIELSKEEIDAKAEDIIAILDIEDLISLEHILSDYKRVLQKNEKYKQFFDLMLRLDSDYFMNCGDEETNKLVDEILKLESE